MDNFLLKYEDYRYLRKHKLNFETQHQVKIILPEVEDNAFCASDIIFSTISGMKKNIENAKNALQMRVQDQKINKDNLVSSSSMETDIPLITLSDSEPDTATAPIICPETKYYAKKKRRKRNKSLKVCNSSASSIIENGPRSIACTIPGLSSDINQLKRKCITTISVSEEVFPMNCNQVKEKEENKRLKSESISSADRSHLITTQENSISEVANDSIIILEDTPATPLEDFIPLTNYSYSNLITVVCNPPAEHSPLNTSKEKSSSAVADDSIIILDDTPDTPVENFIPLTNYSGCNRIRLVEGNTVNVFETDLMRKNPTTSTQDAYNEDITVTAVVPRPLPNTSRPLRPIVIDGNNVARKHGETRNVYSCKGIQISVDYFLRRGHTEITVFVPHFRRYKTVGPFPTTDPMILEELAKIQRVVFTPSRNLNGKRLACYDDRFIVELAASSNGVILSNDNFRDLVNESAEYKKAIEERLLMFVFVGDKLMIPNDPMGREGPMLDEFLSFPPNVATLS